MTADPELRPHQEWLGYLQPTGLVVSAPALAAARAFPNRNVAAEQARLLDCVADVRLPGRDDPEPVAADLPKLCALLLGWRPSDLVGSTAGGPLPDSLEAPLPEYDDSLRPTFAVREDAPAADARPAGCC